MPDLDRLLHDRLATETDHPIAAFVRVHAHARRRRARRRAAVAGGGAVVIALGAITLVVARDPAPSSPATASDPGLTSTPSSAVTPSVTPTRTDRPSLASCVEEYDPATLAGREFAFDGVVTAIGASVSDRGDGGDLGLPGATFAVRHWYAGGAGPTYTVDLQTDDLLPPDYVVGARLLVSGEDRWDEPPAVYPVAWSCGFTRPWTAQDAAAWEDTFAG